MEAGDLIQHTTQDFGIGRVMEVKDGVVMIAFKKSGKKRFPVGSRFLEPIDPDAQSNSLDEPAVIEEPTAEETTSKDSE